MRLIKEDMWSYWNTVDHFIITTNRIIKRNGALVMGAGIAKQVRDKWAGIDVKIAELIRRSVSRETPEFYGCILGKKLGIFQVKYHFAESANLELIKASARMLKQEAEQNPSKVYGLNYPGIGNGKLCKSLVQPLLEDLPDNVWIFHKG